MSKTRLEQLIYRLEGPSPFDVKPWADARLFFCTRVRDAVPILGAMMSGLGWGECCKTLARLLTRGRTFYGAVHGRRLVSYGYVTMSKCRHYRVDAGSAVIGPVWTAGDLRGRGLATASLQYALNVMRDSGIRVFYIDTSEKNAAMQGVLAKCGFGKPIASFTKCVRGSS